MKKLSTIAITIITAAMIFAGASNAQQTPNSQTTPSTPAASSAMTRSKTPAKTGQATAAKPAPLVLKTEKDKVSYAIGMGIGKNMQKGSLKADDIDAKILARGLADILASKKQLLTDEEAKTVMTAFQTEMRTKQQAATQKAGEANKKEGETFLADNKTKEGVVALPSGLQYKILTEGTGPKPAASDSVVCNYKGTLINGKEFDSSYKRGQPATFPVSGVIKGWTEALQLMPVGSKWQLFIPSDLAYAQRGAGADIGPNATLIFEVELISIKEKDKASDKAKSDDKDKDKGGDDKEKPNDKKPQ